MPNTDKTDRENERLKLKYAFIQAMGCLGVVFVIAVGGVISMTKGNDKGLTVLTAIISLLGGYFLGVRRNSERK